MPETHYFISNLIVMSKKRQINIQLPEELYLQVKQKCKNHYDIGISPLIKMFLRAFVTQKGVGFYVGDDDLCGLFGSWLSKKQSEQGRKGCAPMPGPRLKDLYDLSPSAYRWIK